MILFVIHVPVLGGERLSRIRVSVDFVTYTVHFFNVLVLALSSFC